MISILIKKYICSFLLATIIQGFSTKLGIFTLWTGFPLINFLYTILANLLIIYITTFIYWEIFRVFENNKIKEYSELFPNLIKLHKDSIIPPGFILHWKIFSLRTFYALFLTGLAQSSFNFASSMSPFVAENFITFFTHIYYSFDIYLFINYDWKLDLPLHEVPWVADNEALAPPLPQNEIEILAEIKMKQDNALIEQKKTLIRGFFSINTAIWIGGIAFVEVLYMFLNS